MFDANIPNRQQKKSAGASPTEKKASSATMTNGIDDFSFIFGGILLLKYWNGLFLALEFFFAPYLFDVNLFHYFCSKSCPNVWRI